MEKIRITSNQEGFRRGGVAHSTKGKVWPLEFFKKKELEQIKKESKLAVEIFEEDDDAANEDADRLGAIVAAIKQLDPKKDYTSSNIPKVDAIQEILGYDITAEERNEAWKLGTPPDKE